MRVLQMHGNNTRGPDCKVDVSIVSTEFPVTTFVSHSRIWSSIVEHWITFLLGFPGPLFSMVVPRHFHVS